MPKLALVRSQRRSVPIRLSPTQRKARERKTSKKAERVYAAYRRFYLERTQCAQSFDSWLRRLSDFLTRTQYHRLRGEETW